MAIAEADVASQREYSNQSEIIDALESLSDADFLRLKKVARLFFFGKDADVMDIVQESISRVLSGTRPWPKTEPFINFMAGVIKSVADYENKRGTKHSQAIVSSESELLSNNLPDNLVEDHPSYLGSVIERELLAEEELKKIESLFMDDEKALAIVMGREEGFKASEIQEMFDISKTEYESASKKVNRRITKYTNQ